MNNSEYWLEVQSIAANLVSESMEQAGGDIEDAKELINDSLLHEIIDSHQWIIYNSYNLDVIKYSENEDYYNDNFGAEALSESLEQGGLSTLHCHIAFWCLYADVQDAIDFDSAEAA